MDFDWRPSGDPWTCVCLVLVLKTYGEMGLTVLARGERSRRITSGEHENDLWRITSRRMTSGEQLLFHARLPENNFCGAQEQHLENNFCGTHYLENSFCGAHVATPHRTVSSSLHESYGTASVGSRELFDTNLQDTFCPPSTVECFLEKRFCCGRDAIARRTASILFTNLWR